MTEMICIVCPKGCHIRVDEENGYAVAGNECARGEAYGRKELQNPTRTLTSTVRIMGAAIPRLPVKTDCEIPKDSWREVMQLLDGVTLDAPVKLGDIVLSGILENKTNIIATRSLPKMK